MCTKISSRFNKPGESKYQIAKVKLCLKKYHITLIN